MQLVGRSAVELEVARQRLDRHASHDGLDEISVSAPTHVCEVRDGAVVDKLVGPSGRAYEGGIAIAAGTKSSA